MLAYVEMVTSDATIKTTSKVIKDGEPESYKEGLHQDILKLAQLL